ncbi:MAG TPA: NrfD/PsrC family molybdoenzyme membrane anchor subunit [Bryobacteraceae bacterium]|jgi:hypothetical protein|nr:NrfD/PsrC family molybdoenzyme membrane anchor subunit [Bryobacteraceae bacterium]
MPETRYKDSVDPIVTDGRDIDPNAGSLVGEAASQKSDGSSDIHLQETLHGRENSANTSADDPTYYDRPMLQKPVWEVDIPVYYYIGGLTGASLALASAVQLDDSEAANKLVRRAHMIAIGGATISGALLIHDLGRPERFLNMLRVFRPTSPMNVGAWILTSVAPLATASLLFRGRSGLLGALGEGLGFGAGVAGLGLATYTGVLVSNSAVPVWQASRHVLPILFGASAMASAGGIFALFPDDSAQRFAACFGMAGRIAELAASQVMERQVSAVPSVGRPLREGRSGFYWKAAGVLTAASIVASLLPGRSRGKRIAAGLLANLGSLSLRLAIHTAGEASALDARASFHQQRAAQR